MAKGKMTYHQFVTKYKETPDDKKQDLCASHIVNQYVSWEDKLANISKIVDICNHEFAPDPLDSTKQITYFRRNTPLMYYWMKVRLLSCYTDIEIKEGEELKAFNALDEIGAVDALISCIPDNEVIKWNTTLDMMNDDLYINERDLASYLDTKVDSLSMVLDTMLNGLGELTQKMEMVQDED